MSHQVDPQAVIGRLAAQVGNLYAELAMRDVVIDELGQRLAELQAATEPSEPAAS